MKIPKTLLAFIFIASFSIFTPLMAFSESFIGKNQFSFDLGYLGTGLKNNGWGLGINYEQSFFHYASVKGSFSHMTMFPSGNIDSALVTVGIAGQILGYPFGKELDFLYLGGGCQTDFVMFSGKSWQKENSSAEKAEEEETIITLFPIAGWKQSIFDWLVIDFHFAWNFPIVERENESEKFGLVKSGPEYGVKFSFNLEKIFNSLKSLFQKNPAAVSNEKI